jgi:hypothetical protein
VGWPTRCAAPRPHHPGWSIGGPAGAQASSGSLLPGDMASMWPADGLGAMAPSDLQSTVRTTLPGARLTGGGITSSLMPPLVSSSIIASSTETVSPSTLLSLAMAEVPFSWDVGCYTPQTSPSRSASPSLSPPFMPPAPTPRRS